MVNSSISMIVFLVLTILYSIIINFIPANNRFPMTIMYYLLVVVSQFYFTYQISRSQCGSAQIGNVFIWGLVPWIVIFGSLTVLLRIFPGWKAPFSNTFGYLITYLMGIRGLFNSILKSDFSSSSKGLNKIAEDIFEDNSLLINQLTPLNFESAIQKLKPLIDLNSLQSQFRGSNFMDDPKMKQLYRLVEIKDSVASGIWYILTGLLTISVSSMGILSGTCNKTKAQLQQEKTAYSKQLTEKAKTQEEKLKNTTQYFIRD